MKKLINRSDIASTSITNFTYFDRTYGNTYRVVLVDIHLKDGDLIRCFSPYGYGYGDALNETINDLGKNNNVRTSRGVRDLLLVTYAVDKKMKYRECKAINKELLDTATLLADIKIV